MATYLSVQASEDLADMQERAENKLDSVGIVRVLLDQTDQ